MTIGLATRTNTRTGWIMSQLNHVSIIVTVSASSASLTFI
jgi:hypothetical protein